MKTSESVKEISAALIKAQGSMAPAKKDTTNPFFKSRYADLASVFEAVRLPFLEAGIAIVQDVTCEAHDGGGSVGVSTRLQHVSGEWMEFGPLSVILSKLDAQAVGSATSYAKRYSLSAATGVVADDDDDGEAAQNRDAKPPTRKTYRDVAAAPQKAPQTAQEPRREPGGDDGKLSLDEEIMFAVDAVSKLRGGKPYPDIIAEASEFPSTDRKTGKPTGKMASFFDLKDPRASEPWKKKTLTKLGDMLHKATMAAEPGADLNSDLFTDSPDRVLGQPDGFDEHSR